MSVTVTDTRTTWDDADAATDWNTGDALSTVFAEAANSIIDTLNIATGQLYATKTAVDMSDMLIYVWSNNFALQDPWDTSPPPNALMLGDGTDQVSFMMAGNNRKVFAHLDAGTGIQVDWDCLVLDGSQASAMDTAGHTEEIAGTFAALDLTNITQIGSDFTTLSKGLGGGVNVATDIIRYGNDGLRISGGTTGARGTLQEIVNEDQSSADGKAHGIIRTLSTGLYSAQGPLNFGDASSPITDCYFEDVGRVLSFEDRNISDDKYYINVAGSAGVTNLFSLSGCTITTAGPLVSMDFSGGNLDTLTLDANAFVGLGNSVTFSNAADATGHNITNNVFTESGQIDPGDVTFTGNTISDTTNIDGGILLDADGSANWEDLIFNYGDGTGSPIVGHAIYITATGTYDFTNFTYNGYGLDASDTAAVFNDSGGLVTINVLGGDSPTVLNGSGATTDIVNPITFSVSNIVTNSEVRVYDTTKTELAGIENQNGEVVVAKVFNGGTGYSVSDILTVVGGTGTAATLTVTAETGGVITAVSITTAGDYSVDPPSPASVTDAGNSNATFTLTVRGTFTYNYNAASDVDAYLVVFHLDYKDIRIVDIVLSGADQNIPVQQAVDRVYSNPP